MHTPKFFLILASLFLVANPAFAQNAEPVKVVVIPLLGDEAPTAMPGVTYTAQAPIVISTPDPMNPNEQLISFSAPLTHRQESNMQPFLSMYYIFALQGSFPSRSFAVDPYLASVDIFAGNFAPRGWAFCEGQLLPISQYSAVFSLVGTTYGGDGRTTFGLPDLRGRVAIGTGNGPGLTSRPLGQKAGGEFINIIHQ